MQNLELIDLILFLGISQGIFLAITIQFIRNKNKPANGLLSLILLLSVVMLVGRILFFRYLTYQVFQWSILIDAVIFLFGPLCYLYFNRLAFSETKKYKLPWYHYIPVTVHVLFFVFVISIGVEEFSEKLSSGFFKIPFLIVEGTAIISNVGYWITNIILLKAYTEEEKNMISYQQSLVSFLKFFQIAVGVFLVLWVISFVVPRVLNYPTGFINYNSVWAGISIFIFVVGYYSLKEPQLFRIALQKEKTKGSQRLPEDQIMFLEKEMKRLIEEEKMFLKPDLTLRDLSEKLNTSTHNISWYLNTISKSNFYDYINHHRIKEFIKKVENGEHHRHTILALSMEAGFNSKSTFNKAFKLEMNNTPSKYIKSLKMV